MGKALGLDTSIQKDKRAERRMAEQEQKEKARIAKEESESAERKMRMKRGMGLITSAETGVLQTSQPFGQKKTKLSGMS